ncbi:DNA topoisomerase III [Marinobacter sp. F3R08]|uniref:DNA topoisomerase III n=1 Tax=Marinobacter sp. F3R08 TaxID=2841559 RepID=UPI001C0A554D|nr:DNA topoisomerase III [Marinobacter sp. F3R08]MBU2952221.1 DNA topoisomerase III [Marinobacter sp. F3R08]
MKLYLCEKPSQAKDLATVLGIVKRSDGYIECSNNQAVTWAFGHLAEQFMPDDYDESLKRWELDPLPIIPKPWKMKIKKSGAKQFKVIKGLIAKADSICISTDYEREGELIARELMYLCKFNGPVTRLKLTALDDTSIRKALADPLQGRETEPLYYAGLSRARADWLVGMNLSRLYTLLGRAAGGEITLHVGRVVTPTVALVYQRDKAIEEFVPSPFYEVSANILVQRGHFNAKWVCPEDMADSEGRCINKGYAQQVAQAIQGAQGRIAKVTQKQRKENAPLPFDMTSLQQYGSKRWGYTAQEVLDIAQSLYETHKLISYPRTDSRYLPDSQHQEVSGILQSLSRSDPDFAGICAGADATVKGRAFNDSKVSAHNGIIPTHKVGDLSKLNERERQLYDAVRRFYVAQFYEPYQFESTDVVAHIGGNSQQEPQQFVANGKVPKAMGWRVLFQEQSEHDPKDDAEDDAENSTLPAMSEGEGAQARTANFYEKMTRPAPHFTEAALLAAMENIARFVPEPQFKRVLKETSGIGTVATRAGIIEGAIQKGYLKREKRTLRSTPKAAALISFVPKVVSSPGMTAAWEQELEKIASGEQTMTNFLSELERWLSKMIEKVKASGIADNPEVKAALAAEKGPAYDCPSCGSEMRKRKGQYGDFWGCTSRSCNKTFDNYRNKPDFDGKKKRATTKKKGTVRKKKAA